MNNTMEFELADKQRFVALKNAFATLDQFVTPSANPDEMEDYERLKERLLELYKPKFKKRILASDLGSGDEDVIMMSEVLEDGTVKILDYQKLKSVNFEVKGCTCGWNVGWWVIEYKNN